MMISLDKMSSRSSLDPEDKHLHRYSSEETMSMGSVCASPLSTRMKFSSDMERKVWFKADLWILPVVTMFYLLSFLVRLLGSSTRLISANTIVRIVQISEMLVWLAFRKI